MAGDRDSARRTLAAFAERAAAIMETAAAQREDLATLGSTMNVLVRAGEDKHRIERFHLPVPELIEAAVMLRPVIVLQKEPVQIGKVLGALGQLLLDAPPPARDLVREVKRHVNGLLTAERWVVMVAGPGVDEPTPRLLRLVALRTPRHLQRDKRLFRRAANRSSPANSGAPPESATTPLGGLPRTARPLSSAGTL